MMPYISKVTLRWPEAILNRKTPIGNDNKYYYEKLYIFTLKEKTIYFIELDSLWQSLSL